MGVLFLDITAGSARTDVGDAAGANHGTEDGFHGGGADVGVHGADVGFGESEQGVDHDKHSTSDLQC